ncbi:MAG: barstar family protein [Rhodanobacteraceae bacterium]
MNGSDQRLNLNDSSQNGVYFVGHADLEEIADMAVAEALSVSRVDLNDCLGKQELLVRIADTLRFPASFGGNWDALADFLKDLAWLPARGHVLMFEHADAFANTLTDEFNTLLDILDDAADQAAEQQRIWFAFFALPDSAFDSGKDGPFQQVPTEH